MGQNNGHQSRSPNDAKLEKQYKEELKNLIDDGDGTAAKHWLKDICRKVRNPKERWNVLGYAIRTVEGWGRYRIMLEISVKQIEIAQAIKTKCIQSDFMGGESLVSINTTLADSYLNLARANLWLSEFSKSVDYCLKSLTFIAKCRGANSEVTLRITGEIHLCRGSAQLRLGNHRKALEDLERSLSLASSQQNTDLECMSCCALGRFYVNLKDYEKATFFPLKAAEILDEKDSPRNRTFIQLHLGEAYRKVGKLEEAMSCSEEALKFAIESGDRGSQAYCLLCFADIHRTRKDPERALPRYESAGSMMREIGDRYGEVKVLVGKAKVHIKTKNYGTAIQLYDDALKLSQEIKANMESMSIYGELAVAQQRLNNLQEARDCTIKYHKLLEEMELYCGACDKPIAEKHEQLEALPCSHIFHLKCVSEMGLVNTRACPNCRKNMTKPNFNK
ncbi:43 kDa receptor-associated protein of the synapse-like [Styela clava]|uniref:43 kDa receptor-associated protein of the synapse-like n=1 Tax=Styela clava TaxID=7725 RepID=UPI0019396042|nr:43 kDa receptor-associated protein of the synapse-like [Styela clava]